MNIPQTEHHPDNPDRLPPARRRRARRLLAPLGADERAALLDELVRRTSPSFDFYLFSLLSGIVITLGLLIDSPVLLILGAVLAPLMAPVIGISFGTVTGSISVFSRSLLGFVIGGSLVILTGLGGGYLLSRGWSSGNFVQAHFHAQLSWPGLLLVAVGAVLTSAALIKPTGSPALPSVALAYGLYIPLAIAGFGLTSTEPDLWPDGLVVAVIYLAWGCLFGALALALRGFRPLTPFGYTLGGAVTLLGIILIIGLGGAGAAFTTQVGLPTPIPTDTPTPTLTPTLTQTPVPPTPTSTITPTPTPTLTPTITPSPTPTPQFAIVQAPTGGGAFVRTEPGGDIVALLANGTIIQIIPETQDQGGFTWVRVITPEGIPGWMIQSLLSPIIPTQAPG